VEGLTAEELGWQQAAEEELRHRGENADTIPPAEASHLVGAPGSLASWAEAPTRRRQSSLACAFPSGHSAGSLAMSLAFLTVVPRSWLGPTAVIGVVFTLLVSFGVLVLNYHYPSDVLGGWLLGGAGGSRCSRCSKGGVNRVASAGAVVASASA
jgi:hypothetical protein